MKHAEDKAAYADFCFPEGAERKMGESRRRSPEHAVHFSEPH